MKRKGAKSSGPVPLSQAVPPATPDRLVDGVRAHLSRHVAGEIAPRIRAELGDDALILRSARASPAASPASSPSAWSRSTLRSSPRRRRPRRHQRRPSVGPSATPEPEAPAGSPACSPILPQRPRPSRRRPQSQRPLGSRRSPRRPCRRGAGTGVGAVARRQRAGAGPGDPAARSIPGHVVLAAGRRSVQRLDAEHREAQSVEAALRAEQERAREIHESTADCLDRGAVRPGQSGVRPEPVPQHGPSFEDHCARPA